MGILQAILFGVVEGVTEFLPVSSTGHLTVTEKVLGYPIDRPDITAFTAIIQVGAIIATIVYFRNDIWRIVTGWLAGVTNAKERTTQEYRFGWAIILGSVPIAIVGLAFKHQIENNLRSLWIIAIALIGWSFVMLAADYYGRQNRHEADIKWRDTVFIGVVQCLALVPGVSRSGATMSAGLFRGIDRVAVTRLSFFLSIPALVAAGLLQAVSSASDISNGVGWGATIIATIVSFIVAYIAIAWLLKYVARHDYRVFIVYRIAAGLILIALLATNTIGAR